MSKTEYSNSGRGIFSTSIAQAQPIQKRKRGRPPKVYESPDANQRVLIKAKRGRPFGSKNKPKPVCSAAWTHPIIESLKAEIAEAIELQRAHFPNESELTLRNRAEQFRPYRYKEARWPDFAAVAKQEAAEKAAIEAAAAARSAAEDQS